jgi:hypothetical protein
MLSSEFMEKFRSGQKIFDNILLQYCDLGGNDFSGLKIKNSKLLFAWFRDCNFEDAVFENCEMFFTGFRGSSFKNVTLKKCRIDYSGLSVIFDGTRMINCSLSWLDMMNSEGRIDSIGTTEFHVFRSLNELTPALLGNALEGVEPFVKQLDLDMQEKVRNLVHDVTGRYGAEAPAATQKNPAYGGNKKTYGAFDSLISGVINAYGTTSDYRNRKGVYERKDSYRR